MRGTVKHISEPRGFGFVTSHEEERDLFFHIKQSPQLPFDESIVGRVVTFDTEPSDKGPRAVNVRLAD